jgi:hypothetical protein
VTPTFSFSLTGAEARDSGFFYQCHRGIRDGRSSDSRQHHERRSGQLSRWDDKILQSGPQQTNALSIHIFLTLFLLLPKISNIQDELRRFDANVSRIGDLHSRSLNNTDEALSQQNVVALDELVEETRALSNQIKNQIRDLEKESVPPGQDPRIRKNQACRAPGKCAHVFAQISIRRPPLSVRNSSRLCRTISR